jgi:hypothetical protein
MTAKCKITEGAQLLSNAPKPYDAIVYQDATRTYAVDKDGTILSSGLIASQTDNIQIQAAIDYAAATDGVPAKVYVKNGTYYIAATVKLYKSATGVIDNFHFDGGGATFIATSAMGSYKTTISYTGYNAEMFSWLQTTGNKKNFTFENCILDGDSHTGTTGLLIRNSFPTSTLKNVLIQNVRCQNFLCFRDPETGYYTTEASTDETHVYAPSADLRLTGDNAYNTGYFIRNITRGGADAELGKDITDFEEIGHIFTNVSITSQTVGDEFYISSFKNGCGFAIYGLQDSVIDSCSFYDCEFGVYLSSISDGYYDATMRNIRVSKCLCVDCYEHSSHYAGLGLYSYSNPGTSFIGNHIVHAKVGIYIGETTSVNSDKYYIVSGNVIEQCVDVGINAGGDTRHATISNNEVVRNYGAGIMSGTFSNITGNVIGNNGISELGDYNQAGVCRSAGDGASENPSPITIVGNYFFSQTKKIIVTGETGTPAVGQTFAGGTSLKHGTILKVNSATEIIVDGYPGSLTAAETLTTATWSSTLDTEALYVTQTDGVYFAPTYATGNYYYWIIRENTFLGITTPVNINPYGAAEQWSVADIKDNYGYVTENHGRTSIADGATIAHGLVAAPTWAVVTPITSGEFATVTSMDATNLTIAIKKYDNSAGTTQYVNWMCGI